MRLESDISAMKKQRVELTKTLQSEKKKHMSNLNEKAKEIERLKRELSKKAVDVKRLGMEKERAEDRAREAMREGFLFVILLFSF
jgi:precorrin-2 methylase